MANGASTGDGKYGNISFGTVGRATRSKYAISKASRGGGISPYAEIGRTGLRQWGGYVLEEWLSELQGRRGAEMYREIAEQDGVVGGILLAIEMLVRKVEWWVEPADKTNPDDVQAQEMIQESLFEDLEDSWSDTISEIMSMIVYGYHLSETVYRKRPDGRITLAKLATRSQDSLLHWEFDDKDEWQAFIQQPPPTYTTYRIPKEKALLFRTKVHKANPEGKSILRNCVRPYYFRKNLENLMGVAVERNLAGLPMLTPPEGVDIWNTNDHAMVQLLANAQAFVSQVRRDEMEGVVKPFGWEFELVKGDGGSSRGLDILSMLRYYDETMARSMLADILTMGGDKATGSYALSDNKKGLFYSAIESWLDQIAAVFNTDGIPRIYRLNGMNDANGYARLCHGAAETIDLGTIAEVLQAAGTAGAPLFTGDTDDKLLDWLLDKMGAPSVEADDTSEGE